MDERETAYAGVTGLTGMLERGEVSARELVELTLRRVESADRELNAFRAVSARRALTEADAADKARAEGDRRPLLGIPVAVKDDTDVAGEPTAFGTAVRPAPATEDSFFVARLRAAGAVLVGRTRMPEFGQWAFTETAHGGHTRNPWHPGRTAGGSSGGSAAAVAAGLVPLATGTDGGGSLRIPAACCGLYTLKTQRGRTSTAPRQGTWGTMAVFGGLTRSVADAAVLAEAVRGNLPGDRWVARPPEVPFTEAARTAPGRLRIGVAARPTIPGVRLDREQESALRATADTLADLGHDVREVRPRYPEFLTLWTGLALPSMLTDATELCASAAGGPADALALLERRTRENLSLARRLPPGTAGWAMRRLERLAAEVNRMFAAMDLLLTPTIAELPRRLGALDGASARRASLRSLPSIAYTALWNLAGNPAASLPAGLSREGLPLAVQLVGRLHDEVTVLRVSAQLEQARPWAGLLPPRGARA
ncbi:amidase [Streptomyces capparidis]